ncbi:nucleoside-diphosphate-sugar epimerase [Clostridium algifaecis]|uniref:Nucleoside-diphosphate-sugar epimerase n=1 Tax=Clostridium algifaecis TaxID=1472040 RepID=A0ABS4KTG4_9CLOT|nr:NAD-dependent epimerase/dehydratase family protein [Clostridium algifaecis]MBP2033323.1 nucleoside-diphosphate-sugar epimerase [Clostridium algifaecis]
MNSELHVVLGAAGSVGKSVVEELQRRNFKIRAVERKKKINGVETVNADLLDLEQTTIALKDASYVYLCIGLPYNTKVWQEKWPIVMKNVISGCEQAQAKLIFLDNVYMYGPAPLNIPFTEMHSKKTISKKGMVRKIISDMILEAHSAGKIKAVIGRSADFYGPNVINSPLYVSFIERMLKGKAPQSLGKTNIKHTYSYTKDNGRALVTLAMDDSTYGQEWHLPVSKPITIDEIIVEINKVLNTDFKATVIPRVMLKLMARFMPSIKEIEEMLYQADYTYIMSDDKFRKYFPEFVVTDFETGIKQMINSFKS